MTSAEPYVPRYIDIGINLTDPVYSGVYHGTQHHPGDLAAVINRAHEVGCSKLIVTGSDIRSAWDALKLADEHPTVYATAGIHPCSSSAFSGPSPLDPDEIIVDPDKSAAVEVELKALIGHARSYNPHNLVAFGEFGLDYDRLEFCNKTVQLHSFKTQLKIAALLDPPLPLFLHSRAAHKDFVALLKGAFGSRLERLRGGGVVHSFTGTYEEMMELQDLGLYIGVNGCSLKTKENCDVVSKIPLGSIMLETDGPWCEVRQSHEGWQRLLASKPVPKPEPDQPQKRPKKKKGEANKAEGESEMPRRYRLVKKERWEKDVMIKGRNEPCNIELVAEIVALLKGVTVEDICEAAWANTEELFGLADKDLDDKAAWLDDHADYGGDVHNARGFHNGRYVGPCRRPKKRYSSEPHVILKETATANDDSGRPIAEDADWEANPDDDEAKHADDEAIGLDEGEIGLEDDYVDNEVGYNPSRKDKDEMEYLLQKLRVEDRREAEQGMNEKPDDDCYELMADDFEKEELEAEFNEGGKNLDHPGARPGRRRRRRSSR
ncbi:hypothetical protein CP533_5698 [Ophiocordyceps camponoti-saundersi (nom. inval.)]|nr:hypothetical protein CP533_5698 [Ophiocordyceps camponoti-saundersi (nom. inval.)]